MFDLLYLVFPYAVSPTPFKLWGMPATTMIPFFMSISNNGIVSTIEDDQETLWGPNCWKFFYIRDLNIPFFFSNNTRDNQEKIWTSTFICPVTVKNSEDKTCWKNISTRGLNSHFFRELILPLHILPGTKMRLLPMLPPGSYTMEKPIYCNKIHYMKIKQFNRNYLFRQTTVVQSFWNISLYTTFEVMLIQSSLSSVNNILRPSLDVTREIATYN